ncbi:MAG: hypothetical protein PVH68_03175 [Armatimonadota bacterium]
MRTAILGFLGLMLAAGAVGLLIAGQERRAFYRDPDVRAILELAPETRGRLARAEREAAGDAVRRLLTHVLILACLGLIAVVLAQRVVSRKCREKEQHWRTLYDSACDERGALQTELRGQGPQVVKHSNDKTFSALCAKCGCVVTQRFETRSEAAADRARTEVEGCLACPSETRP